MIDLDPVMKHFYSFDHGVSKEDAKKMLTPYMDNIYNAWQEMAEDENDWRGGDETYGFDDWSYTLYYISDRYGCAFRMKWIYDFVNS